MERNTDGTFGKGNSGKPKGAVSKKTKSWRKLEEAVIGEYSEKVSEILGRLATDDPAAFLDAMTKLLPYFKPKLRAMKVEMTDSTNAKDAWYALTKEEKLRELNLLDNE
jgi:hypothetical protein